tara:strand:+ start:1628 stop:2239 length:612 start_codon:yes stop_codon:yes gene_type:complete
MKTESKRVREDDVAAIGIGAMIVFIALILVAAVAAAVIIQTAEKLQQNAETTGEDTAKNLAGKFIIYGGFVATGALGGEAEYSADTAYMFHAQLAPGSTPIRVDSITYQMFCDAGKIESVFAQGSADVQLMDDGDSAPLAGTVELQPQQPYVLWIMADDGAVDCAADNADGDSSIQLHIHIGSGGSTFVTLNIDSTEAGAEVA